MKDFLLEIGVEPLPARFVPTALNQLREKAEVLLKENRLTFKSARTLGTYRRLTLVVEGLAEKSEPQVKRALGPAARLLKDEKGGFTPQAAGFARGQGVKPEELTVVESPKGPVLCSTRTDPVEPAVKILARALPGLVASIEFPKSMVWDHTGLRFGRPIRNLLALLGSKAVPLAVGSVKSGRTVTGLQALGGKPIKIADSARYVRVLKDHDVLADLDDRRRALEKTLEAAVKRLGLQADMDPVLLEETGHLTEHPVAVLGGFDPKYLRLPEALLKTVMKKQQQFFPVLAAGGGLTQHFVGVRDGVSEGQREVQAGFERVLAARLADALFFFEKDLKTSLEEKRERLKQVTFHAKLGTLFDKSVRVERLAGKLCDFVMNHSLQIDRSATLEIARLGYSDIVSEVVREFPELEGEIGGELARSHGKPVIVAQGLSDFHKPAAQDDPIPRSLEGCIAALASKVDTLVCNFSIGQIPTGSEDPYGLRREAQGIARMIIERQLPLLSDELDSELRMVITQLDQDHPGSLFNQNGATVFQDFVWDRAEFIFTQKGFHFDEIRAVKDEQVRNLPDILRRIEALHKTRKVPEFDSLAAAYKRASNILRQAKWNGETGGPVDPEGLKEDEERALWEALRQVDASVRGKVAARDYEAALKEMVRLKEPLDRFFDKVMVMVEDPAVKNNRLALLSQLKRLFASVADLSKLQ